MFVVVSMAGVKIMDVVRRKGFNPVPKGATLDDGEHTRGSIFFFARTCRLILDSRAYLNAWSTTTGIAVNLLSPPLFLGDAGSRMGCFITKWPSTSRSSDAIECR